MGIKEWLWVAAGKISACFMLGTRARSELETMLGTEFDGARMISVYNGYRVQAQQKCLAHLRHFKSDSLGMETRRWGRRFELIDEVCAASAVARNPRWCCVSNVGRSIQTKGRVEFTPVR